VAAAGHFDTHIFRRLVQKSWCRAGESTRTDAACQLPANPIPCGSFHLLSEREQVIRMKIHSMSRIAALFVALAMVVPVFAKPFTKTINLSQTAKIGKASLQAGEYQLSIDGNKATVQKGKNTLAESEGRWEDRDTKSEYTSILVGENGQVREVRFAGQKRVFVFSE
jgi:hypothetical protein